MSMVIGSYIDEFMSVSNEYSSQMMKLEVDNFRQALFDEDIEKVENFLKIFDINKEEENLGCV